MSTEPVNSEAFGFPPGSARCDYIRCKRHPWYQRLWRWVTRQPQREYLVEAGFTILKPGTYTLTMPEDGPA